MAKTSSVVRKSSKAASKPCPKRLPIRLGEIKIGPVVKRLRELHELGGDPAYERFPASEELFRVLEHAETWAGKLKQPRASLVNVVGEAGVLRTDVVAVPARAGRHWAAEGDRGWQGRRRAVAPLHLRHRFFWCRWVVE